MQADQQVHLDSEKLWLLIKALTKTLLLSVVRVVCTIGIMWCMPPDWLKAFGLIAIYCIINAIPRWWRTYKALRADYQAFCRTHKDRP
jgi:hypothetical protein